MLFRLALAFLNASAGRSSSGVRRDILPHRWGRITHVRVWVVSASPVAGPRMKRIRELVLSGGSSSEVEAGILMN